MTHPAAKILHNIQQERFFRVFDDWTDLMLNTFCRDHDNPNCPHEAAYLETLRPYGPRKTTLEPLARTLVEVYTQQGRAAYLAYVTENKLDPSRCENLLRMDLQERAKNPHPADHFAHALGELTRQMYQDNEAGITRDHLGDIYEEEGLGNERNGQFFTPIPLCQVMAALTITEEIKQQEHITLNDPACGSGQFFLAALPHLELPQVTFYGTDTDRTCAKMAALNMLFRNANSFIIWGNSLSLEARGGWITRHSPFGGLIRQMDKDRAQSILTPAMERAASGETLVIGNPPFGTTSRESIQKAVEEHKTRENKRGQFEMEL